MPLLLLLLLLLLWLLLARQSLASSGKGRAPKEAVSLRCLVNIILEPIRLR